MDIHREAYLCCIACLQRFNVPASILISSEQFVAHLSFLSTTLTDHPRQWLKKTSIFILVFGHVSPIHDCLRSIRPKYNSPALPDAAAPPSASQQNASVPLPAPGNDYDVSMDLTAELTGIIDVSEEEARLRAQVWRFEQTFEERTEQHFGSRLVEYERNMAERTWQEVGANRAEVTSALEAVAANNAQLVAHGNIAFEQRSSLTPDSARGVRQLSCASRHGDAGRHSRSR